MRRKEFLENVAVPLLGIAVVMFIVYLFCVENGVCDYRKLWIVSGIPFGIQKMYFWMIPKGFDIGGTVGMFAFNLLVGGLIGYFCRSGIGNLWKCLKSHGVSIRNRLVDYWFMLVFLVTTIYVLANFKVCIDLSFTEDFNGNNLIFLFWLVLIIFPMFDSFEGFGISIKKRKLEKAEDLFTKEYHNNLVEAQEKGNRDE